MFDLSAIAELASVPLSPFPVTDSSSSIYFLLTLVWLTGTGIEICQDGTGCTVSACIGYKRPTTCMRHVQSIHLSGEQVQVLKSLQVLMPGRFLLAWIQTCSCLHKS